MPRELLLGERLLLDRIEVICFLASYAIAFIAEWVRLRHPRNVFRTFVLFTGTAGFIAQTIYLLNRSRQTDLPPLLSSTHDWMLVLAWIAMLFYLSLTLIDGEIALGIFFLPLVILLVAAASFVSNETNSILATGDASRNWTMLHAAFLVIGIAGVVVGLILSLMYLAQHRLLKNKRAFFGQLKLPSLENLARLNWWCVVLSIPFLSMGMLAGFMLGFIGEPSKSFTLNDPVIIGSMAIWCVMIVFFFWRLRAKSYEGKQVALRTVWAFGFLLVILIGLQMMTRNSSSGIESWHTDRIAPSSMQIASIQGYNRKS